MGDERVVTILHRIIDGVTLRKRLSGPPMSCRKFWILHPVTGALEEAHAAASCIATSSHENIMIRS